MAQFTVYSSFDASAPVLTGEVGSLVALLDACLVNGYGAKAAAGWAKTYSGTNKAVYRPASGTQFYLRVQDDGPGAGAAREARMTGYLTVSDVDTGTGPFPTAAQGVGGVAMVVCRKSSTADATARDWYLFADGRTLYLLTDSDASAYRCFSFGDFYTTASADTSNCAIIGRTAENSTSNSADRLDAFSTISSAVTGHFAARAYTNLGDSITLSKHGDSACGSTVNVGTLQYPNSPDGGLYLSRIYMGSSASVSIRGYMRGYWHYCHAQSNIATLDVFSGTGAFAGRSFIAFRSANNGVHIFETSDTVETN